MISTMSHVVKRYPLVIFFGLTYALTWAFVPLIGEQGWGEKEQRGWW